MAKTVAHKPPKVTTDRARSPAKSTMPDALKEAIKSLGADLLRKEFEFLCHEFPAIIRTLEDRMLVQGKDVVRYHADTDSEDDTDSEVESEESQSESDASDTSNSDRDCKKRKSIAIGDEEYTSRMASCENCKEEFNITLNQRGDCMWHPGVKIVDYESDFWADHDVDCHGPYESFEDDPDFAEGFIWDCCDKPGDDEGCKSTKHKAKVNLVVPTPLPVLAPSKKRKTEEEKVKASVKKERRT